MGPSSLDDGDMRSFGSLNDDISSASMGPSSVDDGDARQGDLYHGPRGASIVPSSVDGRDEVRGVMCGCVRTADRDRLDRTITITGRRV
jgi:hypothetical protein